MRVLLLSFATVASAFAIASAAQGCGGSDDATASQSSDGGSESGADGSEPAADWIIAIDPSASPAGKLSPGLLGHYELSGSLFHYDTNALLKSAMQGVGFTDWRVGLGRWEFSTNLLHSLTDGTDCTSALGALPANAFTSSADDLSLIATRDWFTYGTGAAVSLSDTADDSRYALDYVRSVIDVATAYGASPLLDIDHMPRVFAVNKTPVRTNAKWPDACHASWTNDVSNVTPDDTYLASTPSTPPIFASAVAGMVKRVVEGSGTAAARPVKELEFWNEPELAYAWDTTFDSDHSKFFQTAAQVLVLLDAYRKSSAAATNLRFGFGSFANADTNVGVLQAYDAATTTVPIDFFSFHAYSNDPNEIVASIQKVVAARTASTHFKNTSLYLTEWGPNLQAAPDPEQMDISLLVGNVIARAATLGIEKTYQSLFYDFYAGLPFGLVDNAGAPTPLHRAYELMTRAIGAGSDRLAVAAAPDGSLAAGLGAVLVARDSLGKIRVFVVNGDTQAHTVRIDSSGSTKPFTTGSLFADPKGGLTPVTGASTAVIPPKSLLLLEL
jgi:hypothetical protein